MKKEYSEVMEKMCNISDYYIPDYEVMQETMDKLIRAEDRADKAEDRAEKAESELEKYKARFGEIS